MFRIQTQMIYDYAKEKGTVEGLCLSYSFDRVRLHIERPTKGQILAPFTLSLDRVPSFDLVGLTPTLEELDFDYKEGVMTMSYAYHYWDGEIEDYELRPLTLSFLDGNAAMDFVDLYWEMSKAFWGDMAMLRGYPMMEPAPEPEVLDMIEKDGRFFMRPLVEVSADHYGDRIARLSDEERAAMEVRLLKESATIAAKKVRKL